MHYLEVRIATVVLIFLYTVVYTITILDIEDTTAQCGIHSCMTTNMPASLVIGQTDFTTREVNAGGGSLPTADSLYEPASLAFDSSGNLWVADFNNDRVLRYTPPFTNGMSASLVIGQTDFISAGWDDPQPFPAATASSLFRPSSLTFDSSGNLWIADFGNMRVLKYSQPFTNGMSASLVIGQTDFTSRELNGGGEWLPPVGVLPTADSLFGPTSLAFDSSGSLWVVDFRNDRVLRYTPPFTNGMSASLVLGQTDFTSREVNAAGLRLPTADSLYEPTSLAFDSSGNIWVVDHFSHRVLRYTPPFTNGMSASLVLGQRDFTSDRINQGRGPFHPIASSLYYPGDLAFDLQGGLWVADSYNNRVLEYFTSGLRIDFVENGQEASVVLGQRDFTSNKMNMGSFPAASSLFRPSSLTFDSSGNLWVTDPGNSRILEFIPP
jgi:sugar lactone lactonase YvrE